MNLRTLAARALGLTRTAPPPTSRQSAVNLYYEPLNLSQNATVQTVQSAIRQAELGEVRDLFALYRDLTIGGSHVQAELSKRKLALLGEPMAILPYDKENPDDVKAAAACKAMVATCENWTDGLAHLLDSALWPASAVEKIFRPATAEDPPIEIPSDTQHATRITPRFFLTKLVPVNYAVFCYRQPYGVNSSPGAALLPNPQSAIRSTLHSARSASEGNPQFAGVVDESQWEANLRFFPTDDRGAIRWIYEETYPADRSRHIIHRSHLLAGIRDNWGGPMRAIIFWWLLAALGRDWFARFMERYGAPWVVGKTDATNSDAVAFLQGALSLSTRVGGLVVDHATEIDLKEAMTSGAADAYEKFLNVCNREISNIIVGQSSSEVRSTGLGSGVSKQQENVREDIRLFDQLKLGETLTAQLFKQCLEVNNLPGRPPKLIWGGITPEAAAAQGKLILDLAQAGLEPTDEAIPTLSERIGFQLQRKALPVSSPGFSPSGPASNLPDRPAALSASRHLTHHAPRITAAPLLTGAHPSDVIAARKSAVLAAAYRGSLAPVRQIILSSSTPEEAIRQMTAFFSDWDPQKVMSVTEEALQLCAAAGATK